jgi:ankyrin repeat protein
MTHDTLLTKYPFLSGKEAELERAGLSGDADEFKVVAHFIKTGDLDTVKAFIEAGYDIDSRESGDFGSSLLHNAIRYGQMEIFKYLIEQGADINFVDAVGWTPMMEAIIDAEPEFGRILAEKGADQSIVNYKGATAKMLAMKFGQRTFLEFLN